MLGVITSTKVEGKPNLLFFNDWKPPKFFSDCSCFDHSPFIKILRSIKSQSVVWSLSENSFIILSKRTEEHRELIVIEKMIGRRPRGRSPNQWVDQMETLIVHSQDETNTCARDRNTERDTIAIASWWRLTPMVQRIDN